MFSVVSFVVAVLALTMATGARAEGDDDDDDHVFNVFASCSTATSFLPGYTINSFSAELLLDTHVDTYADHYNYVAAGTGRGISP